jgi:phosphoribosylaminoimidazole-succinocarboxamide synthase
VIDIHTLTQAEFGALPLIVEGESKIVRACGTDGHGVPMCVIALKPTVYSFSSNRTGVVPGSDLIRLRACKTFTKVLKDAGISHTYRDVGERFILSEQVKPPNVETIVKAYHSGTSKHRYYGMAGTPVRRGSLFENMSFLPEGGYPHPVVRFDWRNPCWHPDSVAKLRGIWPGLADQVHEWPDYLRSQARMSDEAMGDDHANWFINVREAKKTALQVFEALTRFLGKRDVVVYDLCLFVTQEGNTVFGEISPDCGRFRHFDLGSLDKDVWRTGGSSEQVLAKWQTLIDLIEGPGHA